MAGSFFYDASVPAAVIFAILFGIATAAHVFRVVKLKTLFMTALLVGAGMEFVGFITRVISINSPDSLPPNIISQVALIVAPAFLAAQDYMIVGRIIAYLGSEYSPVSHAWITKIFVGVDVFTILVQAGGGAILGGANGDMDKMNLAKKILLIGLVAQIISFSIFLVIAVTFDLRTTRAPALHNHKDELRRLRKLWIAFYVSALLIIGRSIYRTAEFGEVKFTNTGKRGPSGYLLVHEWPFYVLDAIPTLIAVMIFVLWHPGDFLPTKKGLRIDGAYEDSANPRSKLGSGSGSSVALQNV